MSQVLAHVTLENQGQVTVATITGEVDISNADDVFRALAELPNLALGLVVDLSAVGYLDSTGISLLHELSFRLRQRLQRLIVVCPPGSSPRRVLELTAFHTRTPVFDGLAGAIQDLREVLQDVQPN